MQYYEMKCYVWGEDSAKRKTRTFRFSNIHSIPELLKRLSQWATAELKHNDYELVSIRTISIPEIVEL